MGSMKVHMNFPSHKIYAKEVHNRKNAKPAQNIENRTMHDREAHCGVASKSFSFRDTSVQTADANLIELSPSGALTISTINLPVRHHPT